MKTSIYEGSRRFPSDIHRLADGFGAPASTVRPPLPDYVRRARPVLELLPRTRLWLEALPPSVRPGALAAQFPRIANTICASWSDVTGMRHYMCELFTDRRGGRAGFPPAVKHELLALWKFHTAPPRR
ncbi:MAG: hypothetical protein ABI920_12985 [Casimicrobiaceae bacterium]